MTGVTHCRYSLHVKESEGRGGRACWALETRNTTSRTEALPSLVGTFLNFTFPSFRGRHHVYSAKSRMRLGVLERHLRRLRPNMEKRTRTKNFIRRIRPAGSGTNLMAVR